MLFGVACVGILGQANGTSAEPGLGTVSLGVERGRQALAIGRGSPHPHKGRSLGQINGLPHMPQAREESGASLAALLMHARLLGALAGLQSKQAPVAKSPLCRGSTSVLSGWRCRRKALPWIVYVLLAEGAENAAASSPLQVSKPRKHFPQNSFASFETCVACWGHPAPWDSLEHTAVMRGAWLRTCCGLASPGGQQTSPP